MGSPRIEQTLETFHVQEGAELRRMVLYLARSKYLPDPENDTDDAIGRAYLLYLEDPRQVEVENLKAWLFTRARSYLMDVLRRKERLQRLEPKAKDAARDIAAENSLQSDLEELELREKARSVIEDYMGELTEPKAIHSLRWWLYDEPSAQEVMEMYGIERATLNYHVDKLLFKAAEQFGTLGEYRAARSRRRPNKRAGGQR